MKKYIILTLLSFIAFSCEDFLDEEPIGFRTPTSFYQTEDEIDRALAGVYKRHRDLYGAGAGTMLRFGESRSDNTNIEITGDGGGIAEDELNEFTMISTNGNIGTFWTISYNAIARVNFLLANIDNVDYVVEERRDARLGEALFLRSALYFNLVRIYGDVPCIVNPGLTPDQILSDEFLERDPESEIYSSILEEAQEAIDFLPVTTDAPGRATRGAALMLKAKIHMTLQQYTEARSLLEEITTLGYSLLPNYSDVFFTKNHAEGIFELQFSPALDQGANYFSNFVPFSSGQDILGSNSNPNSRGNQYQPTQSIIDLYSDDDDRKAHNISNYIDANGIEYQWVSKFAFPFDQVQFNQQNINWQMYRYADALLMLAECYEQVGGGDPVAILEQIRERAGLDDPSLGADELADLEQTIADERRRELAFEAHRYFDLLRTGKLVEVMSSHGQDQIAQGQTVTANAYQDIRTVIGIPFAEVVEFGMEQTPGWE
ncbi:RagB/SusD family nutrient uptake outer membrane protein [Gangjinia marincola]